MPVYNREQLVVETFESIRLQSHSDWKLIVVDDGSTDRTRDVAENFAGPVSQSVSILSQANGGAGAARRLALSHVESDFVAFCDSDDPWLPHHLEHAIAAFSARPELDWVFAGARVEDTRSGVVLEENSLHSTVDPRYCMQMPGQRVGALTVLDPSHDLREAAIQHGSPGGLQTSVFRKRVFNKVSYPSNRLGDDTTFGVAVVLAGFRIGFLDEVHVIRRIHGDHVSAVDPNLPLEKSEGINRSFVEAWERLRELDTLSSAETQVTKTAKLRK